MKPGAMVRVVVLVLAVGVLCSTGVAWGAYRNLTDGLMHSSALAGDQKSQNGDQNILIMGLDSRLDENGRPLPQKMYDALHAGDQSDGGYNANVLILLHVPGDGSKATAISIPRDDYVDLVGCPDDQCKGKIKQAYGLAVDQKKNELKTDGVTDPVQLEQQAREAGRKSEIETVRAFLGGVPIDHFVEVTLAAFFQIAQVVQPITVCVNEDTSDSYSGARFHKGLQQINAEQAVAFVRQRRDPNTDLNFTDLDRDRRQQAFIVSLANKLAQNGTLTDVGKLTAIMNVAKQNMAVDSGLDLVQFAKSSANLTSGNVTFFTLPIDHFGKGRFGEAVNYVNTPEIHAIVNHLIGGGTDPSQASGSATPSATPTASPPTDTAAPIAAADGVVLNVMNSSGRNGVAGDLEQKFSDRGFTRGSATTGAVRSSSVIEYGSGAEDAARALSKALGGIEVTSSTAVSSQTVLLKVGTSLQLPGSSESSSPSSSSDGSSSSSDSSDSTSGTTAPATPPTAVSATGKGSEAPAPTNLTVMSSAGIPCVK